MLEAKQSYYAKVWQKSYEHFFVMVEVESNIIDPKVEGSNLIWTWEVKSVQLFSVGCFKCKIQMVRQMIRPP